MQSDPTLLEYLEGTAHRSFDAFLFDIDGTLLLGNTPIPGAVECLSRLRKKNLPVRFLTNNSSLDSGALAKRLSRVGIGAFPEEFITPRNPIAGFFRDYLRGVNKEVLYFRIGEVPDIPGLICFTNDPAKLPRCSGAIHNGGVHDWRESLSTLVNFFLKKPDAPFIVTNPDLLNPLTDGFSICPNGQAELVIRLLEARGIRKERIYLGKPYAPIYREALKSLGMDESDSSRILAVGDSLESDIAGANLFGIPSGLVMTGLTTKEVLSNSPYVPALVFSRLA